MNEIIYYYYFFIAHSFTMTAYNNKLNFRVDNV